MYETDLQTKSAWGKERRNYILQEMANTENMQEKAEDNAERMFHW